MKQEPDAGRSKTKFVPKIQARRIPKTVKPKEEPSTTNDEVINKELLAKIDKEKSSSFFGRRFPKDEKKVAQSEVAFGDGSSTKARSFLRAAPRVNQSQAPSFQKEYVEPWDYCSPHYPVSLPLRRPHSGNPELLDKEEFGEASTSVAVEEAEVNTAEELGLKESTGEQRLLFFQFPANLPLMKQAAPGGDAKGAPAKTDSGPNRGCKLEELPAGFIGKILVYRSGKVKMKIGDSLFDISPGSKSIFTQDLAAINTKLKHCCNLGVLNERAVVTPDLDSLLEEI